jgi:hypothetical protein
MPAFGHVAADEEMPLHRLRPGAHPGQRHRAPVLVDITRVGVVEPHAPPRVTHFAACLLEIVGMDELDPVPADHLLWAVTQDRLGARADLDQQSLCIADQDQILRRLEDAASLFQRCRFRIGFADGPRKGPRQHAGLAARIDRNGSRVGAVDALDRCRQAQDRAGEGAGDDHGKRGRAQDRDQTDS